MTMLAILLQQLKEWYAVMKFYKANGIRKPREVLVIVARSRPRNRPLPVRRY